MAAWRDEADLPTFSSLSYCFSTSFPFRMALLDVNRGMQPLAVMCSRATQKAMRLTSIQCVPFLPQPRLAPILRTVICLSQSTKRNGHCLPPCSYTSSPP